MAAKIVQVKCSSCKHSQEIQEPQEFESAVVDRELVADDNKPAELWKAKVTRRSYVSWKCSCEALNPKCDCSEPNTVDYGEETTEEDR